MGGIDWDLMDTATLERALAGNMQPLIEKLRSGATLRQEERDFIADRLEGKKRLKRGPKAILQMKDFDVQLARDWLVDVEGWPRDAATNRIAEIMGESVEYVRERIRRAKSLNADFFRFAVKLRALYNWKNPFLFKAGKAAGFSEAELDQFRPQLLRDKKLKK